MYLNGAKVVDNDGCHGEIEKHSNEMFLAAGVHSLVVDMCELGGGEVFKMRYQGPDTGNSKITVPMSALKHSVKARTGNQHFDQHVFAKLASSERQSLMTTLRLACGSKAGNGHAKFHGAMQSATL